MNDHRIEAAARALLTFETTTLSLDDVPGPTSRDMYRRATAAVAAIDKAATITTVEELDALPVESVILDREGYPYRRVRQYPDVPSSWEGYELGEHLDVDTIDFPARVIHW